MVDWPDTLPTFKLTGITDQRQSAKLRSSVDAGPPLVRRRFTAAVRNVSVPMTFSTDERSAFDSFWITDLEEGSLAFNWTEPVNGDTVSFRFRSDAAPQFTAAEGGADDYKRWNATLDLEILP